VLLAAYQAHQNQAEWRCQASCHHPSAVMLLSTEVLPLLLLLLL
jgi:hypothetical protein